METKKIKEIRIGDKVYTISEDDFNKIQKQIKRYESKH